MGSTSAGTRCGSLRRQRYTLQWSWSRQPRTVALGLAAHVGDDVKFAFLNETNMPLIRRLLSGALSAQVNIPHLVSGWLKSTITVISSWTT